MKTHLDIVDVANQVLASVAETEKTASISDDAQSLHTAVGMGIKKVAETLRNASESDLDYSDIDDVLTNKTAAAERPPLTEETGLTPLSQEIRKLANQIRKDGHASSGTRKLAANHVINAAIGIKHLTETLK